jgi:hypothetical protein
MLEGVDMALWSDSGGVAVDGYGRNAIFLPGGHSRRGHCNKHFRRTWFPHLDEAVLLIADKLRRLRVPLLNATHTRAKTPPAKQPGVFCNR